VDTCRWQASIREKKSIVNTFNWTVEQSTVDTCRWQASIREKKSTVNTFNWTVEQSTVEHLWE
jgi:hypothetical protein